MLIKKEQDTIKAYFEDSSNLRGGFAQEVAYPESISELAFFMREADLGKVPVTISGGGTSTTGSRVPFGGAVITMERLNSILNIDASKRTADVQSGVSCEDLKRACEKEGLFYTAHPTEKLASLGGTVSTNASGARSFKYGPTRNYINRLKMVLMDGTIYEIHRGDRAICRGDSKITLPEGRIIEIPMPGYKMPNVKNAAGYFAREGMDLIDLFIGQEGTLSVIVEIGLDLVRAPNKIFGCFVFFGKETDAWQFSREARMLSRDKSEKGRSMVDALSLEYFDSNALALLREKNPNVPLNKKAAIFFEQEIMDEREGEVAQAWTELIARHDASLDDTWVAMTEKELEQFALWRHAIPESVNEIIRRNGFQKLSTDIAVPDGKLIDMLNFYTEILSRQKIQHVIFGHIGESHLHVNLLPASQEELGISRNICLELVRKGISLGGTVSAEHGIGKIKHRYLEEMYGRKGILEMAALKKAFDPNCLLGLNNIFPKEILALV
ncbi:MAG: FAD-binding oxidoreductase [Candidatus Omnitrophica bacterium]|nr:FAD-binding oxidoreductase [Candidatus Omnitrophota bacterium]